MEIRPIRTEAGYQATLAEITRLFHAAPGTSEGDVLDVLATLVETYLLDGLEQQARRRGVRVETPVNLWLQQKLAEQIR